MQWFVGTLHKFFQRSEPWVFVAALVVVLGVWGLAALTGNVMEGDTTKFDTAILLAFRQPQDLNLLAGPGWLLTVVRDATALGGGLVIGLVLSGTTGFLLLARRYHMVVFLLVATLGATGMNYLMKLVISRARPAVVPHLTDVTSLSFPSGHSAMSAAVYLTIGALLAQSVKKRRLKLYFVLIALLITGMVGLSRVMLGVHYPTDVLAGWASGLAWALLCWIVARYLQRRGAIEKEADPMSEQPPAAESLPATEAKL